MNVQNVTLVQEECSGQNSQKILKVMLERYLELEILNSSKLHISWIFLDFIHAENENEDFHLVFVEIQS